MQKIKFPLTVIEDGTIIEINYPYEDKNGEKIRPGLVIEHNEHYAIVIALKISSVDKYNDQEKYPYAFELLDFRNTGLKRKSWVLTNKMLKINDNCVFRILGHINEDDFQKVIRLYNLATINGDIISINYR